MTNQYKHLGKPTFSSGAVGFAAEQSSESQAEVVSALMAQGGLHRIGSNEQESSAKIELLNELIRGYFGWDIYLTSGPRYRSPQDYIDKEGMALEAAIDEAINHNRIRCLHEMNFFLSGDESCRQELLKAYESIASGTYDKVELASLQTQVRSMRCETEIEARIQMKLALCPSADKEGVEQEARHKVGEGQPVDLKLEIELSRKEQIAQSINAKALELVLGADAETYALKIKLKTIAAFMRERLSALPKSRLKNPIDETQLNNFLMGLLPEQRAPYIEQIVTHANTMRVRLAKLKESNLTTAALDQQLSGLLLRPEDVNLSQMRAKW